MTTESFYNSCCRHPNNNMRVTDNWLKLWRVTHFTGVSVLLAVSSGFSSFFSSVELFPESFLVSLSFSFFWASLLSFPDSGGTSSSSWLETDTHVHPQASHYDVCRLGWTKSLRDTYLDGFGYIWSWLRGPSSKQRGNGIAQF